MKFSIISDVHVKSSADNAETLLLHFLKNPDVVSSDVIFLLGDIFDLMIGPHSQYYTRFNNYFDEIKKILKSGTKICYVQGNHDFHLDNLYKKFFSINSDLNKENFKMSNFFVLEDSNKKIYLCHGDDIELDNPGYKIFKSIVTSTPLRYYANYLMPHFLIKTIGEYSSEKSRKRNNERYSAESDLEKVKKHFRYSVSKFHQNNPFDIIVCGHSHVKDLYDSPAGFIYVNNGYAQHTKTYISIENGHVGFKPIIL